MKNILTIDFDIIMAPTINAYNDSVPKVSWDYLQNDPLLNLAFADLIHYYRLTKFLFYLTKFLSKEKFHFVFDHQQVVKWIPLNEPVMIWNIDHHHDLGYADKDLEDLKGKELNCANWVKWVIDNSSSLVQYNWIGNENSTPPHEKNKPNLLISDILKQCELEDRFIIKPDEVIIVLSPPWVPPRIRPLYDLWRELLGDKFNTTYEIETVDETERDCGIVMHEVDKTQ